MYEFVVSVIGDLPPEFSIVYIIFTFLTYISFLLLLISPLYIIFSRRKGKRF